MYCCHRHGGYSLCILAFIYYFVKSGRKKTHHLRREGGCEGNGSNGSSGLDDSLRNDEPEPMGLGHEVRRRPMILIDDNFDDVAGDPIDICADPQRKIEDDISERTRLDHGLDRIADLPPECRRHIFGTGGSLDRSCDARSIARQDDRSED